MPGAAQVNESYTHKGGDVETPHTNKMAQKVHSSLKKNKVISHAKRKRNNKDIVTEETK